MTTGSQPVVQTSKSASVKWAVPEEVISSAASVAWESRSWGSGVNLQTGNWPVMQTGQSAGPGLALPHRGQTLMKWESVREESWCLDARASSQVLSLRPALPRSSDQAVSAMGTQAGREAGQHVYPALPEGICPRGEYRASGMESLDRVKGGSMTVLGWPLLGLPKRMWNRCNV